MYDESDGTGRKYFDTRGPDKSEPGACEVRGDAASDADKAATRRSTVWILQAVRRYAADVRTRAGIRDEEIAHGRVGVESAGAHKGIEP